MGIGKGKAPNSLKNLKPIRKGEVRNPLGGQAPGAVYRRMTQAELKEIVELAVVGDFESLKKISETEVGMSFMKKAVAGCLYKADTRGDWHTINAILERILGKVPNVVQLEGNLNTTSETPEEKEARKKRIAEKILKLKELDG